MEKDLTLHLHFDDNGPISFGIRRTETGWFLLIKAESIYSPSQEIMGTLAMWYLKGHLMRSAGAVYIRPEEGMRSRIAYLENGKARTKPFLFCFILEDQRTIFDLDFDMSDNGIEILELEEDEVDELLSIPRVADV